MFFIEHGDANANIKTIGDALWWSIITLTTIAYGDKYPVTFLGKVFAAIFIILGIGTFSALIVKITSSFIKDDKVEEEEKIKEIQENIDVIEDKIDILIKHDEEKEP
jgi:voltage-gated potassium channel